MAENNIMGIVGAFIGIAIMLGIGIQILGNSIQDCTTLSDYSIGEVISISVGTAGNYTSAPSVVISGGGGTGASATAVTSAISGGVEISSITVTEGGTNYASAPDVSFSGGTPVNTTATATATISSPSVQAGWAGECERTNTQTQNAYTLLVIILIVVAAVAIISVIRMLG